MVRFDPLRPGLVVPPGGPSHKDPHRGGVWIALLVVALAVYVIVLLRML